jgi:hypothetical protein
MKPEELDNLGFHEAAMARKPRKEAHEGRKEGESPSAKLSIDFLLTERGWLLQTRDSSPVWASRSRATSTIGQITPRETVVLPLPSPPLAVALALRRQLQLGHAHAQRAYLGCGIARVALQLLLQHTHAHTRSLVPRLLLRLVPGWWPRTRGGRRGLHGHSLLELPDHLLLHSYRPLRS